MPTNQSTFTIKGKLDIRDITSGLDTVKSTVQSMDLGTDLTADILKDINAIQKKMTTAFSKLPGAKATSKQVETFSLKMEDATADLNLLIEKLKNFGASDKYIKENIASIQQFANEITKASKKTAEARGKIDEVSFNDSAKFAEEGHFKTRHKELTGKMRTAARQGETADLTDNYNTLKNELQSRIDSSIQKNDPARAQALTQAMDALAIEYKELLPYSEQVSQSFKQQTQAQKDYATAVKESTNTVNSGAQQIAKDLEPMAQSAKHTAKEAHEMNKELQKSEETGKVFESLQRRIKSFFSVTSVFYSVRRVVRGAIQDFQELDKQFNEIAIVSDYSTKEMWESFSSVNKVAQDFGVETKNVLEVQNLYYHQGKSMAEVNKLTAQTLTLAKITGMDYEKATSDLTAALNAYNIAAEDAVRVTDTIAAMDTNAAISSQELMTALTKTASIAANAGMSLESTEVFLTKMIETTREAPENLGTALKTIIARFGEVKQEVDGEEIELADINRVDTALKSIGISLLDTAGQIRDLDGVFMELSSKWDDLDRNTQRYIATIAAGSRQQSRFIAMMEDYDRTLELTEIAQNSAGLGARQLAKSQESIETSVNRLKSTWQEFYSSLITSGMIKSVLELGNTLLSLVNTLNDTSPLLGTIVAALAIWAIKTQIVDKGIKKLGKALGEGVGQASIFETVIISLVGAMDEQTRSTLLASGALDKWRDSLKKAGIVAETSKTSLSQYDNKLIAKGFYDPEKRQSTETGTRWVNFNHNRKKPMGIDRFSGYNNTLNKLLGEEGASNFLKETSTLKGTGGLFKKAGKGISGTFKTMVAGAKALGGTITSTLSTAAGSLGAILTTLWPILLVVGVIGAGFAYWKTQLKASLDDTKKVEKLSKAQEEYNKQLKETNTLKEKAKQYEQYRNADGSRRKTLTSEQMEEEQAIAKELVAEYPSLLEKIDEEGNYHLKNTAAIQEEIKAKEKLLDQSAKTYTEARLKATEHGIYTDTSTQAGQAIKNIQDYAATFGIEKLNKNEDLKEIAERIDSVASGAFNKSGFYDIMEGYASGKKSSFDERDFSDLFAGAIVYQEDWERFLATVKDLGLYDDKGNIEKTTLETALIQAGYTGDIEAVTDTFIELNKQLGGLYGELLEGAANEQSEIYVELARMEIDKFDFNASVGNTVKDAMSEAAERAAKGDMTESEWIAKGDERDTLVENKALEWESDLEKLTDSQLASIEKFTDEENVLGAEISNINSFLSKYSLNETTDPEDMKTALKEYWNYIPDELRGSMPELKGLIDDGSEAVIRTLFEILIDATEDFNSKNIVKEISDNYEKSLKNYEDEEAFVNDLPFLDKLSGAQAKQLNNILNTVSEEQQTPYLSAFQETLNNKTSGLSKDQQQEFLNTLLGINFTDMDSVMPNLNELMKFGFTVEEVYELMAKASNGAKKILGQDAASIDKRVNSTVENFTKGMEGLGALMSGTATSEQLGSFFSEMENYYTMMVQQSHMTADEAANAITSLGNNVQATGDGFKLASGDATEYGNSLYEVAIQAINMEMSLLQSQLAMAETNEEIIRCNIAIAQLKNKGALLDAQMKKTFRDNMVKDLEDAKEKADKLVDSIKAYVDWLRDFDKYQNINEILETLGQDFENLEFEIGFSTNTDVIEQDIEKTISNLNTQIAANQGKRNAAQSGMAMWRDTITRRNSDYVSFDAEGNAIVNAERLQHLQEEIKNASEERKPVLQAEYDEIMSNVKAYNKEKDVVNETTKNLQDNFKALEDFLKAQYDSIMKVEDKLIEARMAAEDKELDTVKEKYEAIKEENDKYLESVQDMIDEERRIRDQAEKEEDVRNKEKKLAMMKMDTSGIYSSDIRSLEKELENDYRELEDTAVDKAIEEMNKTFETQAEIFDKEIEYLENSLEYKRETMTEYNQWAQEMMKQGSDTVLAYLKANDEEYYTGTAAAQANWILEWNNSVTQGIAANNQMGTSLQEVFNNLEACKDNAGGFEDAIVEYGSTAMATNGEIEGTVNDLSRYYQTLVNKVDDLELSLDELAGAYENAARAARNLKAAQDGDIIGSYDYSNENPFSGNQYNPPSGDSDTDSKFEKGVNLHWQKEPTSGTNFTTDTEWWIAEETPYLDNNGDIYQKISSQRDSKGFFAYAKIEGEKPIKKNTFAGSNIDLYYKYATGGYVDYTGPAWVDGTKSRPEYMLNATQTQQFETLVAALSSMFSNGSTTPISQSNQKIGDTQYNFHINVEQMANDYDVDQLLARLEKKIQSTSKYRQVTYLNKSNT